MVKLKSSPKNLELGLDINVAKKLAIPRFSAASSKFRGKRRILRCVVKICMPWNTAGPDYNVLCAVGYI